MIPVLRNSRRMRKAFYDVMYRGKEWKKPPLIHKGRKS